ncbi:MAG: hypothetical protein CMF04_07105 [Hyphomonas sp.]|nr:hypothetical protein [Hyphomonas sp.]
MTLRIAATLAVLLLTVPSLAACGEGAGTVQSETQTSSNWEAQCLADLSEALDPEIESLKAEYPSTRTDRWSVNIGLEEGEAHVTFFSGDRFNFPINLGYYQFSCADKTIQFVPRVEEK